MWGQPAASPAPVWLVGSTVSNQIGVCCGEGPRVVRLQDAQRLPVRSSTTTISATFSVSSISSANVSCRKLGQAQLL